MQFYPKSYLSKTRRLSCLEHGMYCQLLFMMWEGQGALVFDRVTLSHEVGLTLEQFDAAWIVVGKYFTVKKGKLYNDRISEDLQGKKEISKKRANAANDRWAKNNKNNNGLSDANAMQSDANKEPKPEPEPCLDTDVSKQDKRQALGVFEDFWKAWPHKVGKPAAIKAYQAALKRRNDHEQIMSGLERYIRGKPPDRPWLNPATFLNQERFNDEPASSSHVFRAQTINSDGSPSAGQTGNAIPFPNRQGVGGRAGAALRAIEERERMGRDW